MSQELRYVDNTPFGPSAGLAEVRLGPSVPVERSTRRHVATAGGLGWALERQDIAQPLRTYVPETTRARAAALVLWCRVALAVGGTALGFTALTVLFLGLWRLAGWVTG